MFVANDLANHRILLCTAEFTVERNHTNVHCVTNILANPSTCSRTNAMYTTTENLTSVVSVESYLKWVTHWSFMFVFTLMQSHTHVDTAQIFSDGMFSWSDICWSYTMKVLGSRVTVVRRNSFHVVIWSGTHINMETWSRMFAVSVQNVSVQQVLWNIISWCIQTINSIVAVCAVNISDAKLLLYAILRGVQ